MGRSGTCPTVHDAGLYHSCDVRDLSARGYVWEGRSPDVIDLTSLTVTNRINLPSKHQRVERHQAHRGSE
jgi:hypothetical protein